MPQPKTPWPPGVGDVVRVKDSGLCGTTVKTKGVYETRFRLEVRPTTADGTKATPGQARAARIASRWYGLDELEPV